MKGRLIGGGIVAVIVILGAVFGENWIPYNDTIVDGFDSVSSANMEAWSTLTVITEGGELDTDTAKQQLSALDSSVSQARSSFESVDKPDDGIGVQFSTRYLKFLDWASESSGVYGKIVDDYQNQDDAGNEEFVAAITLILQERVTAQQAWIDELQNLQSQFADEKGITIE
jgi:hypothetical protein